MRDPSPIFDEVSDDGDAYHASLSRERRSAEGIMGDRMGVLVMISHARIETREDLEQVISALNEAWKKHETLKAPIARQQIQS